MGQFCTRAYDENERFRRFNMAATLAGVAEYADINEYSGLNISGIFREENPPLLPLSLFLTYMLATFLAYYLYYYR
jgi:hypothetical protein